MKTHRAVRAPLIALTVLALVVLPLWLPVATASGLFTSDAPNASESLTAAFERAQAARAFHMSADLDMKTDAASARGGQQALLRIEGDIAQPERWSLDRGRRARLSLGDATGARAVDLVLVDGNAFVGNAGRWEQVESPRAGSSADGDYLGFLAAAVDVQEEAPLRTAAGELARYTFRIDGPRFAEHVRTRTEAALKGQLPAGATVVTPDTYKGMTGSGELWVDRDGWPRREILTIDLPTLEERPASHMDMAVTFTRFDEPVAPIEAPLPGEDGVLRLPAPIPEAPAAAAAMVSADRLPRLPLMPVVALALTAGLLMASAGCYRFRRHRAMYTALVVAVSLSMVGMPLVHAEKLRRFHTRAGAPAFEEALADVGVDRKAEAAMDAMQARIASTLAAATETGIRDCRTLIQGVSPISDTDHDGLTNEVEWCLGTNYQEVDTDHDTITDSLEVAGFDYGGPALADERA